VGRDKLTDIQGPNLVLFADKAGVRKMLLEADLPKSPIYDAMRVHRDNATLFTETDKAAFKVSVLKSLPTNEIR